MNVSTSSRTSSSDISIFDSSDISKSRSKNAFRFLCSETEIINLNINSSKTIKNGLEENAIKNKRKLQYHGDVFVIFIVGLFKITKILYTQTSLCQVNFDLELHYMLFILFTSLLRPSTHYHIIKNVKYFLYENLTISDISAIKQEICFILY